MLHKISIDMLQNGRENSYAQVRALKNSGKKPDPENPGKNPDIKFLFFGSDFKNGH